MADRRWSGLGLLGCVGVCSGTLVRLSWLPGSSWRSLGPDLATTAPDRSLPLVLSLLLCALVAWVALTLAVTALAGLPGRAGRLGGAVLIRLAPRTLRRAAEVLLGATTVLAVTTGAAQAAGPAGGPPAIHQTTHQTAHQTTLASVRPAGLDRPAASAATEAPAFSLDRPVTDPARGLPLVTAAAPRTPVAQAGPRPPSPSVTVREGDSLWRIAARALPPGSSDAAIDHSWRRWYGANRGVIGPDPGLLQPGQRLTPPTP